MVTSTHVLLQGLPIGLRNPLLAEYGQITSNYVERRWRPSELSGGHFAEICYTILEGYAHGSYADEPSKPDRFVDACRALEKHKHVPRSFQILIPRLLPGLYEIRNNRGVGHVGGEVDPNAMDAAAVLSIASWIMAEFVRVFHNSSVEEAQQAVDALSQRPLSLVWEGDQTKRVLDPALSLRMQILVLLASSAAPVPTTVLSEWTQYKNRAYLRKLLQELVDGRFIYVSVDNIAQLLPPGSKAVDEFLASRNPN